MSLDVTDEIADVQRPRRLASSRSLSDWIFRGAAWSGGLLVLAITGGIALYLLRAAMPTFRSQRWDFLTEVAWEPDNGTVGIAAMLAGSVLIGVMAILISFPLALATALFITEYATGALKRTLVTAIDLMVAVPSIIYGLWGFYWLQPKIIHLSRWLSDWFGWFPLFRVDGDPEAPVFQGSLYASSAFIAAVVVCMMVVPIAASIMREVFDQTPRAEREAALALGATRADVVRSVVLPFGRGGMIGGTMLGLGRALGETIAVVMIISPLFEINWHVLESGSISISSLIALRYAESRPGLSVSALMAAGFALFMITLVVNLVAGVVVARSRSGSATEA